jgi:putative hydrolase
VTNGELAELLALSAEESKGNLQKALRRASRMALTWDLEAADLAEAGELTALEGVGPHLERIITKWMGEDVLVPRPDPLRSGFLTYTEVRRILAGRPGLAVQGDLQSHTTYSDGGMSVSELAAEAEAQGFKYQAITDHSKGLKIAGGMDEDELARQIYEIHEVNERYADSGFRLLKSLEMNLSVTGEGDMEPDSLKGLDIVLGSFHSKLRIKEDQTDRYLAALANPYIEILGHPQGRMYNFRSGLTADWPRVFAEATRLGKAVEVDAFPDRQDLRVDLLRIAVDEGTTISIGSDTHWPGQLRFVDFGLAAAIEAGVPEDKILNLLDRRSLLSWVEQRRDLQNYAPA